MRGRAGFTLLEVLVATTILAVAIGALMSNLTASVRNLERVSEADRAALAARRKMDELLAVTLPPRFTPIEGQWPAETGLDGGWRARRAPFEAAPGAGAAALVLDRIELTVWWKSAGGTRSLQLEGYRTVVVREGP